MRRGALAAVFLAGCFVPKMYARPRGDPGAHVVREDRAVVTPDGWRLAVVRYHPERPAHRHPVLVVHGIVTNARYFDLDAKHSFLRWMAARGWDVWAVSLRGTGESEHAREASGPDELKHGHGWDYDFDTFAKLDVPAVAKEMLAVTGADSVDYVGHSMGGLVLYAALARRTLAVHAAVACGSPVRFRWGTRLDTLLADALPVVTRLSSLPVRSPSSLYVPITLRLPSPLDPLLMNPDNVDPESYRAFVAVGVDDLSGPLVRQFARFVRDDDFVSDDGALDYRAALARLSTPLLVVAGKVDNLAPPWAVAPAYRDWGTKDKQWLLAGEESGLSADYGHLDMFLGEKASKDLWPRIEKFLADHER